MNKNMRHPESIVMAACFLLAATLACGTPTTLPTAPSEIGAGSATPTAPPVATETLAAPAATATSAPDVTAASGCTLNAGWVADVTVPDNTEFTPGTAFVKTWRVRNSGTCTWEAGTQLVFASGDQMGGPASVSVPLVSAGAETDISVNLTAPATPGTYRGNWQFQAPDGTRFGAIIYVKIVVPALATAIPTGTPTPGPMCTPPSCPAGQIAICPGPCTGGCGMVCATLTPTSGCVAADTALQPILTQAGTLGLNVGCPTAPATSVYGALQKFWTNVENPNPHARSRDYMIWRSDTRKIYALALGGEFGLQGPFMIYNDTWVESQPEVHPDCAGMTVPTGYQLPVRGFGKAWCENSLWTNVGWPNDREWGVTLLIQPTQNGLLIQVSGEPSGYRYLFALDFPAGKWTSTAVGP